jgi:hypothetical protein
MTRTRQSKTDYKASKQRPPASISLRGRDRTTIAREGRSQESIRDRSPPRPSVSPELTIRQPVLRLEHKVLQRLGYGLCSPVVLVHGQDTSSASRIDWSLWDDQILDVWGGFYKDYIHILAYFIRRVKWSGEGVLELALLMERYCNPTVPGYKPFDDRLLSRLRYALGVLQVQDCQFVSSVVFALVHRHRFFVEDHKHSLLLFVPAVTGESYGSDMMTFSDLVLCSQFIKDS